MKTSYLLALLVLAMALGLWTERADGGPNNPACAMVDVRANVAVWWSEMEQVHTATYVDMGDHLVWTPSAPRFVRQLATHGHSTIRLGCRQ